MVHVLTYIRRTEQCVKRKKQARVKINYFSKCVCIIVSSFFLQREFPSYDSIICSTLLLLVNLLAGPVHLIIEYRNKGVPGTTGLCGGKQEEILELVCSLRGCPFVQWVVPTILSSPLTKIFCVQQTLKREDILSLDLSQRITFEKGASCRKLRPQMPKTTPRRQNSTQDGKDMSSSGS